MTNEELKKSYHKLEQLVLILMILALPIFGMVYLYFISGNLNWNLPQLPGFVNGLLVGFSIGLLVAQYVKFHQDVKAGKGSPDLMEKVSVYIHSTRIRFYFLFLTSLICAIGLLFFKSEIYVVLFAVALVFFSLAKPTPDRIKRLFRLNKEDAEFVRLISRPD
ncbi:hypothetical protein [Algoriphagus hitonicola]|uniref:Uncharacterized protein n=1 Tax=Algoriphagus hitonicola TaxID=435880 RepID=A0A1I2P2D2_9BACT|nr:hypothetical protein [Algoriphagus hitonicola]SFG07611.1 hypothetical protein SAMN04487988_101320 [Algoriphagus hitonicola]